MYSKMHYKEKVAPRTAELIQELKAKRGGKLHRGETLACVKAALDEVYGSENQDKKSEVHTKIAERARALKESKSSSPDRTPATYAK